MEHLGGFFDGQTQCENDLVSAHDLFLHDDSKPQAHAKKVSSPLLGLRHLFHVDHLGDFLRARAL